MDKIEVKKRADDLGTFQWPLMGYAPGYYMRPCLDCKAVMTHCDKRATQCLSCALTSILATRTDATPVGYLVRHKSWPDEYSAIPLTAADKAAGHTETPLYTHPPATDVAALVEAAKETNAALERDGDPAFAHLILDNKAALAPFTKGQP